jgi:hypothetical protein
MKFTFSGVPEEQLADASRLRKQLETIPEGEFWQTSDVAREYGVNSATIRFWANNGRLEGYWVQIGKYLYFASQKTVNEYRRTHEKINK